MLTDQEIFDLINDSSEESRELVFNNYEYIINIYLAKYKKALYLCSIDKQEAYAEGLFAFNEAISSYDVDKDSSFKTYLSLCVSRRLIKLIRKSTTNKSQFNNSVYSLDYIYDDCDVPLVETLEDATMDPGIILESEEQLKDLDVKIKSVLSDLEYEVYKLMIENFNYVKIANYLEKDPKQIDNAMQRIKIKIRNILDNEKTDD